MPCASHLRLLPEAGIEESPEQEESELTQAMPKHLPEMLRDLMTTAGKNPDKDTDLREVATAAGLSMTALKTWLKGQVTSPGVLQIYRLATALGAKPEPLWWACTSIGAEGANSRVVELPEFSVYVHRTLGGQPELRDALLAVYGAMVRRDAAANGTQ